MEIGGPDFFWGSNVLSHLRPITIDRQNRPLVTEIKKLLKKKRKLRKQKLSSTLWPIFLFLKIVISEIVRIVNCFHIFKFYLILILLKFSCFKIKLIKFHFYQVPNFQLHYNSEQNVRFFPQFYWVTFCPVDCCSCG